MNMLKRLTASALALVMALSALSGCGGGSVPSASQSSSSSSADSSDSSAQAEGMDLTGVTDPYFATAGISGDTVVARVGDAEVTAAELLYWINYSIEYQLSMYGGYITELPWDLDLGGVTLADQIKQDALDATAFYALLPALAQQEGLSVPQETLDELNDQHQQIIDQLGSEEIAEHYLWYNMLTWDVLYQQNQRGNLHLQLQDLYYGEDSDGYPTDAEVLAYAQDELGCFRVKHILLMTMDQSSGEALDDETVAQKRAQAEDLLAQLRSAEDPIALFDELMNQYSEDGGLATNPDGYVFDSTASLVDGFREAALELEVGQISDIVETAYGYHIMLRLPLDPEDYRSYLVAQRMQDKIDALLNEYGVETTDAYDQIDLASFYQNVLALQTTAMAEVEAALQANSDSSEG